MSKIDQFLKDWAACLLPEFLDHAGLPQDLQVHAINTVMVSKERLVDGLFETNDGATIIHIEFQVHWSSEVARRICEYQAILHRETKKPILTIVFAFHPFNRKSGVKVYSAPKSLLGRPTLTSSYYLLYAKDLDAEKLLRSELPNSWALACAAGNATQEVVVEAISKITNSSLSREDIYALINHAFLLNSHQPKKKRMDPAMVRTKLKKDNSNFMEVFLEELAEEKAEKLAEVKSEQRIHELSPRLREEGRVQGLKEGLVKGLEEGLEKGMRLRDIEIARRLLAQNLPHELKTSVTGVTEKILLEMASKPNPSARKARDKNEK